MSRPTRRRSFVLASVSPIAILWAFATACADGTLPSKGADDPASPRAAETPVTTAPIASVTSAPSAAPQPSAAPSASGGHEHHHHHESQ